MNTLFENHFEEEAINRIKRFADLSAKMGFEVAVGFSGGKDSQVVYDLCKRAEIDFKAYYNVCFESNVTKKFIKDFYPEVIWRREHKFGFIENIWKNHSGILPTDNMAYCCKDYKHNPKYADASSVVGVRKQESAKRKNRTVFSAKNKTTIKKNDFNNYFKDSCQSIGTSSIIQLLPIVDWSTKEVWDYITKYKLPINTEYKENKRIGCIVCPQADFTSNVKGLLKHPKLVDAFILARGKGKNQDWIITSDNKDYTHDKVYYICRWLNRSFLPFNPKQEALYAKFRELYDIQHNNK